MAPFFMLAASTLLGSVSAAAEQVKTWGKNIHWVSLREGQKLVKDQKKPAMIVFHKPWCRACKALRPRFANSREIEHMASDFVMISVEEDDVPKNPDLSPDGSYIPRILFMDPEGHVLSHVYNLKGNKEYKYYYAETNSNPAGNVMKHIINKGSEGFKYYYFETDAIVDSMKQVLKQTGREKHYKTM